MFFLLPASQTKPSILEPNKDAKYHSDFARYCIGQSNNARYGDWIDRVQKNKRFYASDQWSNQEDIDSFLKDDNNNDRNRLTIVDNIIKPMVIQFRGNAIRMGISYGVKSVSPMFINRRETKLAETLFYSKIANEQGNPFGEQMKKQFPVGDNEAETRAIFKNVYVDEYVRYMNGLCRFVSERNHFSDEQDRLAEELALSGLGVKKTFEYGGHQEFIIKNSENFFFDNSARKHDLSDGLYMGDVHEYGSSEVFEMSNELTDADRKAIEEYVRVYSGQGQSSGVNSGIINNGRVPVYTVYWKDGQKDEFGYVKDKYGYDFFTKINFVYPGETEPRYTDKDLIKVNTQKSKKILGNKLKTTLYYDVLRMCSIIPKEILGSNIENEEERKKIQDIVLDWGIAPYQETENQEYASVKFPYKCYTWAYQDGEIMSPIDDAIDPQRFVNRVWSVAENQINNSRGSGTAYDKDMVEDEAQLLMDMNQSKPVGFRTKGLGIQNVVGSYDGTIKNGTQILFNIIDAMKDSVQKMTGVNDALKGESTGSDQLVGVTQLMIQRGSLMQEPFYNALTQIYKQCYNSICTVGKRIYCDNQRNGVMAIGDEGIEVINITKEMRLEDFRCFVKRQNTDEMLTQAADQMLITLKQLQMLDDESVANLWGRSTPDEVANALRKYTAQKAEIARMSQKTQLEQQNQMLAENEAAKQEQMDIMTEQNAREDIKHLTEFKAKQKSEALKGLTKLSDKSPTAKNLLLKTSENLLKSEV